MRKTEVEGGGRLEGENKKDVKIKRKSEER